MFRKRECCLHGEKVLLVPYSVHHVKKYHEWMQDPVLRELTASEPLTLEKEYEMQQSWMNDEDKCTFIILSRELYEKEETSEIDSMVGDVNMFLSEGSPAAEGEQPSLVAEIDIMIAKTPSRGRGLGLEATCLMMSYGIRELGIDEFRAKVKMDNNPSLTLFRDKLKFRELSRSEVFKEITLKLLVEQEHFLDSQTFIKNLSWTNYVIKSS